jgi:hypothetical protein
MGQMTIYLDDEMMETIKQAAELEDTSASRWVRDRIEQSLEDEWPGGYFDLFGSVGGDFVRPEQPDPDNDTHRVTLE